MFFTEVDIQAIRELSVIGMKQQKTADFFGVNQRTISDIVSGRSWGHVT